jgi:glycosyltransferase involved in cell wall biosynthesis
VSKIVHILGEGRPGGGTTIVLGLSRALAASGHRVTIIAQSRSLLIEKAAAEGFEVREIDFARRSLAIVSAKKLAQQLRQLSPAIVHAHGARAGLPCALAVRRSAAKFIYSVQGFHFRHKPQPLQTLAWGAEAFCMSRADCTVLVSQGDRRIAEQSGLLNFARAWQVINNAVAVDPALREMPKAYDIGFLGRLHYQKNPLILVDILKALRPLTPSLCVIGGGDLAEDLRNRLATEKLLGQVALKGELGSADALCLLAKCRLLLLPSRWEGHPFVVMEAMQLGLPVVASNIPGTNEIVRDGKTGFLVSADDPTAFAERIAQLLQGPELIERMGREGQELAANECSVERMAQAHFQLYFSGQNRPLPPTQVAT